MKLSSSDLHLLCQCAISAAYQAGHIISKQSSLPVSVNTKKGGTSLASQVVTEVDHLAQEIILQTLSPTYDKFDLALLTEETPDDLKRLSKDFFWCIDPMDGTLSFIQSRTGYAVSIGLVSRDGAPQIGVVYDPVEKNLYYAIKDAGAFYNGKPWKLKPTSVNKPLTFMTDQSFTQHKFFSDVLGELKSIATILGFDSVNTIQHGGAVMNACWVLEKSPACYFKFPKAQKGGGSLWDYAATACLFLEAGAVASDIFGRPLDLNRPDSTFMNHNGVIYTSNIEIATSIMNLYVKLGLD